MKEKKHLLIVFLVMVAHIGVAQQSVLCPLQTDIFEIENSDNIPVVTSNGDDTITLTFPDQNVTDVFANHTIYNFFQVYPDTDETLEKYYKITFDSRGLIQDVAATIPNDILEYAGSIATDNLPLQTSINSDIIQSLDGNSYAVTKYVSTSDSHPCNFDPNCMYLDNVPDNFIFEVNFNFNSESELLMMETEGLTSCGNAFSIGLTGLPNEFGIFDNALQLWESTAGTSTETEYTQPCHSIEGLIFSVLDIACYGYNNGFVNVVFNTEANTMRLVRENQVFGFDIIEFAQTNLSVEDQLFQNLRVYEKKNSPYLQIANLNNQSIKVAIFNTSGQQIIQPKTFEENNLNISNLSTGLYFINISNLNNQQKIFKFLKN